MHRDLRLDQVPRLIRKFTRLFDIYYYYYDLINQGKPVSKTVITLEI